MLNVYPGLFPDRILSDHGPIKEEIRPDRSRQISKLDCGKIRDLQPIAQLMDI